MFRPVPDGRQRRDGRAGSRASAARARAAAGRAAGASRETDPLERRGARRVPDRNGLQEVVAAFASKAFTASLVGTRHEDDRGAPVFAPRGGRLSTSNPSSFGIWTSRKTERRGPSR